MLFPSSFSPASDNAVDVDSECHFSEPLLISFDDVQRLRTKGYLIVLAPFGRLTARRPIARSDRR